MTWIVDLNGQENFTSIQTAIDSASTPDTILVRPGTYQEQIKFNPDKSGIFLKGDGLAGEVVIEADTMVIGFWNIDPPVRVENFTLTGGNVYGALWIQQSRVEIVSCIVRNNTGPGACVGVGGGGRIILQSDVLVENCLFEDNHSWESPGGLIVWSSRADIRNNTFRNNSACYGGGLEMYHCEGYGVSTIEGNLFLNNGAEVWGGGLLNIDSSPVIRYNTFVGNGGFGRAAVWVIGGQPEISNNIIVDSHQAIYCHSLDGFPPSLPTIGDNLCWQIGKSFLSNCPSTGLLRVEDPFFCDTEGGVFSVCADSPAIEENTVLFGAFGRGCDECSATPIRKTTWGDVKRLLERSKPLETDLLLH